MTLDQTLALARTVLERDDTRFEQRLEAVIRHAGWEERPLDALTADERLDVVDVLERIRAGRLYPHLRTDGSYAIRTATTSARR